MPANIDSLLLPIYIFTAVFCLPSPILVLLGLWSLRKVFAARNWRVAPGRVVEPTEAMRQAAGDLPVVAYDYTVGGQTYQSTQVFIRLVDKKAAYAAARRYPAGAPVRVYFNPLAPSQAVLERYGLENLRLPSKFLLAGTVMFLISLVPFGVLWLAPVLGVDMVAAYLPGSILTGVLAVAGLVITGIGAWLVVRVWMARGWYPAFGQVLASSLRKFATVDGGQVDYPVVVYEYMVNGRRYSSGVVYGIEPEKADDALDIVSKYQPGEQTTIYFDPNNPANAAIERPQVRAFFKPLGLLALGLLVLAASAVPVIITFVMQRAG